LEVKKEACCQLPSFENNQTGVQTLKIETIEKVEKESE
jgi:hypothetical protein